MLKKYYENSVVLFKQWRLLFKKQYQTAPNKQKKTKSEDTY